MKIHTYTYKMKSTGLDRVLNGYSASGLTKHYYFDHVKNVPDLDKCDIAIFGNILPQDLRQIIHDNKYYLYCSPFGQADLSNNSFPSSEITILYQLLFMRDKGMITNVITTDVEMFKIHKFEYVPPVLNIDDYSKYADMYNDNRNRHGFLGNNLRKHRNTQNQLVAMSMLEDKLPIVINTDHAMYHLAKDFYGLDFIYITLDDKEYFSEIARHKLNFQATYSESFNYMALEYGIVGVPTICCPDVGRWYPIQECVVKNVDSPVCISETAKKLMNNGYWEVSRKLHEKTKAINEEKKEEAYKALKVLENR